MRKLFIVLLVLGAGYGASHASQIRKALDGPLCIPGKPCPGGPIR